MEEYSGFQVKLTTDQFTRITSVFKTQSLYKWSFFSLKFTSIPTVYEESVFNVTEADYWQE